MLRARVVLSLVAVLLTVVSCTPDSASTTTSAPLPGSSTSDPGETTTTTFPEITELPGTESLPPAVREELLELVNLTQEIRELSFMEPPRISVVTSAELESLVREQIAEDADELPSDEALYRLLGLLDEDTDLQTLLTDLYGEQVAGFYDGETQELVVPITSDGFSPVQRATLIHELTHALTDQHFSFQPMYQAMFDEQRYDQASAYQALIEGDASWTEFMYLRTLSTEDLGKFFAEALQVGTEQLEAAPEFIQKSLIFPYDSGMAFVQDLHTNGGWDSVNLAYQDFVDFPGSTEQIITPDDYGRDLPVTVAMHDIDVPGYELIETSVWGELGLRILFGEVLDDEDTLTAADGWGGDTYSVWYDGENVVFVLVYAGDTATDETEAEEALLEFARTSVPEEAFVWVDVFDDQLTFIASDVPSVGEAIRDSLAN